LPQPELFDPKRQPELPEPNPNQVAVIDSGLKSEQCDVFEDGAECVDQSSREQALIIYDDNNDVTVVQPNEDGSYWRKIVRNKMVTTPTNPNQPQPTPTNPRTTNPRTTNPRTTNPRTGTVVLRTTSLDEALTSSQGLDQQTRTKRVVPGQLLTTHSQTTHDSTTHLQVRMKESRRVKAAKAWMGEMVGDDKVGSVLSPCGAITLTLTLTLALDPRP
jgi:hypothetical protein